MTHNNILADVAHTDAGSRAVRYYRDGGETLGNTYAEQYARLTLAKLMGATHLTLDVEDEPVTFSLDEAIQCWDELAPGEHYNVIGINFDHDLRR